MRTASPVDYGSNVVTVLRRLTLPLVMPSLGGITARIFCDGAPLEEYSTAIDPEDLSTISCWVASKADKELAVHCQIETHHSCAWGSKLHCDGVKMASQLHNQNCSAFQLVKARDGGFLRPMFFSEILETDSQEAANKNMNPLFGVIRLSLWRVESALTPAKGAAPVRGIQIDESPVHETKKTLGGHHVKLGPPKYLGPNRYDATPLDRKPYRVFNFFYRPKALLQAMGHVPPSPSSSMNPLKRSISELSESSSESETDGEEEKIAAQVHVLLQIQDKIRKKKEAKRAKAGRSESKRLKQEAVEIVVPAGVKEEIIELSD